MARQRNMHYTGTIENIIYYQWKQDFYMRSKPMACTQTSATKKRSTNFGIAARAAKVLRAGMMQALPFPKDKNMQNRFTAAIVQWLGQEVINKLQPATSLPFIDGFAFNTAAAITARFRVPFTIMPQQDTFIEVALPAFIPVVSIQAPASTIAVHAIFNVAACQLHEGTDAGSYSTVVSYNYNETAIPAQVIRLPLVKQEGTLVTLSMALEYIISKKGNPEKATSPAFMPAGIIAAVYV